MEKESIFYFENDMQGLSKLIFIKFIFNSMLGQQKGTPKTLKRVSCNIFILR